MAKQTFQLTRCGCTLGVTSQTSLVDMLSMFNLICCFRAELHVTLKVDIVSTDFTHCCQVDVESQESLQVFYSMYSFINYILYKSRGMTGNFQGDAF